MTSANRPTDQDFELLSAYLDNELGVSQRAALEMRLAADPALVAALEDLRRTLHIVRSAPRLTPPRNFTLDPARYGRRAPWWSRYATMQLMGAVGSAAAILLIVVGLTLSSFSAAAPNSVSVSNKVGGLATGTLARDSGATIMKSDGSPNESTALFAATSEAPTREQLQPPVAPQAGAENGSSGFTAAFTATPIPTLPPTSTAHAESQDALNASSGGGPGANSPAAMATPTSQQAGVMSGAAQPAPFQPQPTSAPALADSSGSGGAASKMDVPTYFPSATSSETPTATPTNTPTATATRIPDTATPANTVVAVVPTAAAPGAPQQAQDAAKDNNDNLQQPNARSTLALPQLLLIAGIALLVFSAMLAGIGWMTTRIGRNR